MIQGLREYQKVKENYEKTFAIARETGDIAKEVGIYLENLIRSVLQLLGEDEKVNEHYEKVLAIKIENGDKKEEGEQYGNLGNVFH